MRKTFLFHIGLPKTGTTSIQGALVTLSDALRDRGVWVPYDRALYGTTFPNLAAPPQAPQADGLPFFCDMRHPPRRKHPMDWAGEIAAFLRTPSARSLVFSHESLSQSGHRLNAPLFRQLGQAGDIRFLGYLRHPLPYLNSYSSQKLWGFGRARPRIVQPHIRRYVERGFAGQLAPFEAHGVLDLRDYEAARVDDGLIRDVFSWLGAADLIDSAAPFPARNVHPPLLQLWAVLMAMKISRAPEEPVWTRLRDVLETVAPPLESAHTGLLHPASIPSILERWEQDRAVLAGRYGLEMPSEAPGFIPGPETLSFSPDYARALRAAAAPHLDRDARAVLDEGLALAGEDIEDVCRTADSPATSQGYGKPMARAGAEKAVHMQGEKTFLFHIGLPKTGTTSIQGALVTLSDALRDRGVWVPYDRALYGTTFPNRRAPNGAPQNDGFHHFVDARPKRLPDAMDWPASIETFLADPALRHYVFSHENFSHAGPRLRQAVFADLAARGDLEFLVYLRHPLSYLGSFMLWQITGRAGPAVRRQQAPVRMYLRDGFTGLLAPFAALGRVIARDFDVARQDGRLVEDAFSAFGAGDVVRDAPPLEPLNASKPRYGMACVLLALKATSRWSQQEWFAMRPQIIGAYEALEPRMTASLIPQGLARRITERWQQDRETLAERFGITMPLEMPGFAPGPERMVFSRDYAERMRDAVAPRLDAEQRARLEAALALAGTDLEAYIRDNAIPDDPIAHSLAPARG